MNSSAVPKKIRFLTSTAMATLLLALLGTINQRANALPVGGVVAGGTATISANAANTTITINQSTDRAAIDWSSFDLAVGETVEFIVPSSNSATLNRITGPAPSQISGTITSNGAVYFTNPNGLIFDANSRVTTNGFIASTGTMTAANFMNQTLPQFGAPGTAMVALGGIMTGDVRIEAATVTVPTNLSISGGNLYFNLPSTGTVTTSNSSQITTNGHSILFSGASSGNNVIINLAGINGGSNGVLYNTKFLTGDQNAASTIPSSSSQNGFTVNNGSLGLAVITTGILAIDGIRSTSLAPLWLEGGGVSMLSSHIDLQGSVTVVGHTSLTTSGSTSAVIYFNEGINVWGEGSNITIKQIGDLGTASDNVNNTIMALNINESSLWAPKGNITLSSNGAITTSGGAIGIRFSYSYLKSRGTTTINQTGAITSRSQANTVGILFDHFYPIAASLSIKQEGLIIGTASQGPSVYGIDMRNSILEVGQFSLSKIGGLESVANVGIWGIYSRSNSFTVTGGAGTNNMILDAGVTRLRMGDDVITTSGSSITVRGDSMNLNGTVSSSGGPVTLTLSRSNLTSSRNLANSGAYTNNAADPMVGQVWTSNNQNLTLNADGLGLALGQTVFNLGNGSFTSNRRKFGTNIYVSNDPMITAANIATVTDDSSAEYHSLTEFINGISGYGLTGWGGTISYRNETVFIDDQSRVTFWNLANATVVGGTSRFKTAKEFIFAGTSNSINGDLRLQTNGNVTVSSPLSLSGGAIMLALSPSSTVSASGQTISTNGGSVYIQGGTGSHSGTINLGGTNGNGWYNHASFYNQNSNLQARDIVGGSTSDGFTLTGSSGIRSAIVTDGILTIDGVTTSVTAPLYLLASGIIVSGTASQFGGDLLLEAQTLLSNSAVISIAANLTTNGSITVRQVGAVTVAANGAVNYGIVLNNGTLTANGANGAIVIDSPSSLVGLSGGFAVGTGGSITVNAKSVNLFGVVTSSGGSVFLNLGRSGSSGSYSYAGNYNATNNGIATSNFAWTTNQNNLTLNAASMTAVAYSKIFDLGSAMFNGLGLMREGSGIDVTSWYNYDETAVENRGSQLAYDPTQAGKAWHFYGDSVQPDSGDENNIWLNVKGLNRGVIKLVKGSIKTAGLDRDANGIIIWHNIEGNNALTTHSLYDLPGHNITFHSIGTAANPFVLDAGKSLATANSISFSGTNYWNGLVSLTATTSITFGGSNFFDSLSLTSGGAISQTSGSITLSINGNHSLSLTSGGVIDLSSTSNALTKLALVRSRGAITIRNQGSDLILNGAISSNWNSANGRDELGSANPIVIDLGNGRDLSLSAAVTSTGGSVTLTSRNYTNNNFEWDLSGNRLTVFVTDKSGISQTGTVFNHVQHLGGNLITFGDPNIVHYFTSDRGDDFTATQASLSEIDPTAVLHDWSDFSRANPAGLALEGDRIAFSAKGQSPYAYVPIGFYNLRLGRATPQFQSSQIIVRGFNRVNGNLDLSSMPLLSLGNDGVLTVANLTLGNQGAIDFGSNGQLNSGQIIATGAGGVQFISGNRDYNQVLTITSQLTIAGELRLSSAADFRAINPRNSLGRFTAVTQGASLAYRGTVTGTMDATTGGGSISVDSNGNINLVTHEAGAIEFRVAGTFVLSGSFAASRGSAQSIKIDSSSITVYGNMQSDQDITIAGSGSVILVGDMSANGSVTMDQPVMVMQPASVISQSGGIIAINGSLNSLQQTSLAQLLLEARNMGRVNLDRTTSNDRLGWVTVISNSLSNPKYFDVKQKSQ